MKLLVSAMSEEDAPQRGDGTFGTRYLQDEATIYEHNAWDNVEMPESKLAEIERIIDSQRATKVDDDRAQELLQAGEQPWNQFYDRNADRFFKDRKWLAREFPDMFKPHQVCCLILHLLNTLRNYRTRHQCLKLAVALATRLFHCSNGQKIQILNCLSTAATFPRSLLISCVQMRPSTIHAAARLSGTSQMATQTFQSHQTRSITYFASMYFPLCLHQSYRTSFAICRAC